MSDDTTPQGGHRIRVRTQHHPRPVAGTNVSAGAAFRPPELVEKDDEALDMLASQRVGRAGAVRPDFDPHDLTDLNGLNDAKPNDSNSPGGREKPPSQKLPFYKRLTKKHWLMVGATAGVLLLASLAFFVIWPHKAASPAHKAAPKIVTTHPIIPATVASTLTGLQVAPAVNQRPVTAVMIENSTFARPQSGLDQAGVVFEAVAEGGITRFLALYQDTAPSYLGPVRSVRPYYLQWLMGFDAAVAHVGGSPEAIADIKAWNVKNLDQEYNGSYFHRISSRAAPHNVYTSVAELNALEAKLGYGAPNYTGFARKPDAASKTPNATSIDFNVSSAPYAAHYDYDAATNSYKRSEGGQAHMQVDQTGAQTQIAPKVVIALVMPQGIEADDLHTSYATIGSGLMYVFQDGIATQGTWRKTAAAQQFSFTDTNGNPIKLNAGQTWLTAVGSSNLVRYK